MASKRPIRRKKCGNKVRYPTQEEAMNGIYRLLRGGKADGCVHPYKCNFCGGYHFGHTDRKTKAAIAGKRESK